MYRAFPDDSTNAMYILFCSLFFTTYFFFFSEKYYIVLRYIKNVTNNLSSFTQILKFQIFFLLKFKIAIL